MDFLYDVLSKYYLHILLKIMKLHGYAHHTILGF